MTVTLSGMYVRGTIIKFCDGCQKTSNLSAWKISSKSKSHLNFRHCTTTCTNINDFKYIVLVEENIFSTTEHTDRQCTILQWRFYCKRQLNMVTDVLEGEEVKEGHFKT
jgi:hypothetical protein